MPILDKEPDIYPVDLLSESPLLTSSEHLWYAAYTISRREKELSRRLHAGHVAFYAPVVPKRLRSPRGRIRTSFVPLFSNYVFFLGTEEDRYKAFQSNCISRCNPITDHEVFLKEIRQIHLAIQTGVDILPETKLAPGQRVRVLNGPFRNYEGIIVRREGKTRLLLSLKFIEQGVSFEIDECQVAAL
jgi:hypothetical protein